MATTTNKASLRNVLHTEQPAVDERKIGQLKSYCIFGTATRQGLDGNEMSMKTKEHCLDPRGPQSLLNKHVSLVQTCAKRKAIGEGRLVHAHIEKTGFCISMFIANTLIDMYIKCGRLLEAEEVFDRMPRRNVFTWTIMISGYAELGILRILTKLMCQMQCDGIQPNYVTYVSILSTCATAAGLYQGKHIHSNLIKRGLEQEVFVGSSLIHMYARCGSIESAYQIFDTLLTKNVVCWTAIISGYTEYGNGHSAIMLFKKMQSYGIKANKLTYLSLFNACACMASIDWGKYFHSFIIEGGLQSDVFLGSALICMYMNCGSTQYACQVFYCIPTRDVVSWTAMISGYALNGSDSYQLVNLFEIMQQDGLMPNKITCTTVLAACANIGALECGKGLHIYLTHAKMDLDVVAGSALIDMYAKCGNIKAAQEVFDNIHVKNLVLWSTLISGYAEHGHVKEAFYLFQQLCLSGFMPDRVILIAVLVACSYVGLLDMGLHYFISIGQIYEIGLTCKHYACIVDLLGHLGHLDEAKDFINTMAIQPDIVIWKTFLNACLSHRIFSLPSLPQKAF